MAPFENDQQAAEALAAAVMEDGGGTAQERAIHEAVANKQEAPATDGSEGTTATDSFTGIDPQSLPDALQPIYKSMQADYTRSKQGISEEARAYEALNEYGGAEAALEAVQFAQALSTDPNYALQVHEQLTEALTAAGLTPAQASAEAERQIEEAAAPVAYDDDEYGADNPLVQKLSSVEQELQSIKQWRAQEEERAIHISMEREVNRQEAEILNKHPEWANEEDLEAVYALAYSTGGNLIAAAEQYKQLQDRMMENWINQKSQVPAGLAPTPSAGAPNAEEPTKITSLFDPRLEALVNQRLAEEAANGNI